jgi:hypothetical protein
MICAEIFVRHLDLAPLRGRTRGVVRCIFHDDRTASLSVDVAGGIFHCFGCGVKGGILRFAELVGEILPRRPRGARSEWLGPLHQARHDVLAAERSAGAKRARFCPLMEAADDYRITMREVMAARAVATTAGPESLLTWELLTMAATAERRAQTDLAEATA